MSDASSKIKASTLVATIPDMFSKSSAALSNKLRGYPMLAVGVVLVLFVGAQLIAAIVGSTLISANKGAGLLADSNFQQFLFVLLAEGLTLGGLFWFLRFTHEDAQGLGLKRGRFSDIAYAVGGYIVYFVLYIILVSVVTQLVPALNVDQKQDIGFQSAHGVALLSVFISLVILAPVTEEIIMRGYLFGNLRPRMSFLWATLITSLVFASAHLLGGERGAPLLWIAGIDTFVLSVVLCYLRQKTGRLWAGIGLHALKNSVAFISLFVLHYH